MIGPRLQLETLYRLDERDRILSTREPQPAVGPAFVLIRSRTEIAWAVHANLAVHISAEVIRLARREQPVTDWRQPPVHAGRYRQIFRQEAGGGPSYVVPDIAVVADGLAEIDHEAALGKHFSGWVEGEIAAGRGPMIGRMVDGQPVSICFCARQSEIAAEAGLQTSPAFRGRGFAPQVVAAWAAAVRASGRLPLYSTDWKNTASQRVAMKLGLIQYATTFDVSFDAKTTPPATDVAGGG